MNWVIQRKYLIIKLWILYLNKIENKFSFQLEFLKVILKQCVEGLAFLEVSL